MDVPDEYNLFAPIQGGLITLASARSAYITQPFASVLILAFAAFVTRLLPMAVSQYPFNNDSITECLVSGEILSHGHLATSEEPAWNGTHSILTPLLNVLLAFYASTLGAAPLTSAQVLGAVIAMTTVGGVFMVGRLMVGNDRGAVVAAFLALLFGTFVFTTGSVWKETLGLALMVFALMAFLMRKVPAFRVIMFVTLMMIPFVHHLVAAVTFLVFMNLLSWSLFFSVTKGKITRTNLLDLVTISIPTAVAATYYAIVGFDSLIQISSVADLLLIAAGFIAVNILSIVILSLRSHVRTSFAPIIGVSLAALILLDFSGLVFPYDPSASDAYVVFGLATSFMVALAWFGSEIIIERNPRYRAVQLALLLAPLAILGFGALHGGTVTGQKIIYRSFDFLDFFLFFGAAAAIVELRHRRKKLFPLFGALLIACVLLTFPFSYASQSLLGVRHDTQGYELDSLYWLGEQPQATSIVSDERLAYLARSVLGVPKDSALPQYIADKTPFPSYLWFYIAEESWTSTGVNNYPYGELVVDRLQYDTMLEASDVFYVGGPEGDNLVIFVPSPIGSNTVYGPSD